MENRKSEFEKNRIRRKRNNLRKNKLIRKKTNNKKFRIFILLLILFIIFISIFLLFIFRKKIVKNKKNDSFFKNYYTESFNRSFNQYNSSLYYKNYTFKDGKYTNIKDKNLRIKLKTKGNFEYYLWLKLNKYFNDNKISQEDLSLSIFYDKEFVLNINPNQTYKFPFEKFVNLLMIRDALENKEIDYNNQIILNKEDLTVNSNLFSSKNIGEAYSLDNLLKYYISNEDKVSGNMLIRYLNSKGKNIESYLNAIINKNSLEKLNTIDSIKLIKHFNEKATNLNLLFTDLIASKNEIFSSSIHSDSGNINLIYNDSGFISEIGYIDSNVKFYYSLYSLKLTSKNIADIGDIINRTINEIKVYNSIKE